MKQTLLALREQVNIAYSQHQPILILLEQYTFAIDDIIIDLFQQQPWPESLSFCLLATGGYGRKELFPYSDCDLAIITSTPLEDIHQPLLASFIAAAWDCGLKVHSTVRTFDEAISQSQSDHSSYSSLLENRLLLGDAALYEKLQIALFDDTTLPLAHFITQKKNEQQHRHHLFNKTSYNLEPDVKNGPGGLRDLHILQWLTLRRFNTFNLAALCDAHFITQEELLILNQAREFLLSVRFALHELAHRAEDRLSFDFQPQLADIFAISGETANQKVEAFMQTFFTNCHTVLIFSEIILSLFIQDSSTKSIQIEQTLNDDFFVYNNTIFHSNNTIFSHTPTSIMKLFLFYAENQTILQIAPNTIRELLQTIPLIDDTFRQNDYVNKSFLAILQSNRVYQTLSRMSRYGILGAYLPAFAQITRKMQYDLFHVYTVDAHTLFVIRNVEHFIYAPNEQTFPLCAQLMRKIVKPELLYLAALFHDIGKGHKESHSIVGARLIAAFGEKLALAKEEIELITWLVEEHLLLSKTAQHKDLNDRDEILQFAKEVKTISRLNHLYLLTVADIHATNEKLWNNWRASLLEELYVKTFRLLNNEDNSEMLSAQPTAPVFDWETQSLPVIQIKQHRLQSATEIYIYSHYDEKLFCRIACILDNLRFTIVEATTRLTSDKKYCFSTYVVLEHDYTPISRPDRFTRLQSRLEEQLKHPNTPLPASHGLRKRQPSAIRFTTQVYFDDIPEKNYTIMTLITRDRPGLLAQVGKIMVKYKISLQKAKISTLGDRVEDFFYIMGTETGSMISATQKNQLSEAVCLALG
jgi:[protein-PII] uridylyltransferase